MTNIFENAKFGDKFITIKGEIVIFICEHNIYKGFYCLINEENQEQICCPNGVFSYNFELYDTSNGSPFDVIGRWQEPIDEEKLDELALKEYASWAIDLDKDEYKLDEHVKLQIEAYKTGCKQGWEERQ